MRIMILCTAALTAAAVGCDSASDATPNALVGKVTLGGQPLASESITVIGPGGEVSGGTTNADGDYLIPDPPTGQLTFQLMPQDPGRRPAKGGIPAKYTKPGNDLGVEYTGGRQTYDIELSE